MRFTTGQQISIKVKKKGPRAKFSKNVRGGKEWEGKEKGKAPVGGEYCYKNTLNLEIAKVSESLNPFEGMKKEKGKS